VSELGEILELIHTSVGRWRTVQASGREWVHHARSRESWERSIPTDRGSSVIVAFGEDEAGPPEPDESVERWLLYMEKPNKTRAEFTVGAESVRAVTVGNTWWSWSASGEVSTNDGDPHQSHGTGPGRALVDPAAILPMVELDIGSRRSFLDRPAIEVIATPSSIGEEDEESLEWRSATHGLGTGANEYALLVDAERGILLRSEARLGGQPFRILEVESVAFDVELPGGTFDPPKERDIERLGSTRMVSLPELPTAVSFTVLVPEQPPFGPPDVRIDPADHRHGIPEQVHINYWSPLDGEENRQFWLIESAEATSDRQWVEWEEESGILFGEERHIRPVLRIARREHLGTHVEIQSYYLGTDELVGLARSLVPLPETSQPVHPVDE
jgi:hypothetical protein